MKLRLGRRFVTELAYERPPRAGRPSPFERERLLDPAPVESILEQALANLKAAFPALADIKVVERWAGYIDATPDAVPAISAIESLPGLYLASGFSGHGIVQSPAIGVIMSQLILDGESRYDVKSIEADRYFDMPGYLERADIEAKCVDMAGNYYGKVERPSVGISLREPLPSRGA